MQTLSRSTSSLLSCMLACTHTSTLHACAINHTPSDNPLHVCTGLATGLEATAMTQPSPMGGPPGGALVGDSEVAAAKRAKHGNDMATSVAQDEGQLQLVPIPPPPAISQQVHQRTSYLAHVLQALSSMMHI